ncbi:hypothetical protein [Pedobacter sp. SL55]|uniref:hypothetical protein n=1 Tax=Pedobacter sp. SL55 TaxID=2995161 RepID=UPI00226EC228|nr:hypothetical protein [Pedobacter sp. SL55]WAC40797.1 hypothetical protein OVA16_19875 [Pedobacter sp. SL55]
MDENQKQNLAAKKHQIQLRISANEFIDRHLINWLEIYEIVVENDVNHELVQLANITDEEISFWEKRMATEPFNKFNLDLQKLNTDDEKNIVSKLYATFPSTYPLRYMPSDTVPVLAYENAGKIIADFALQLQVDLEEEVFLFYLYYTPVLKLKLKDIIAYADSLYDFPTEDILIASPNFDWLIFRSTEEEWRFCRRPTVIS